MSNPRATKRSINNAKHEPITEHQPIVLDSLSDDDMDSCSSSDGNMDGDIDPSMGQELRRYTWCRAHYVELLERFLTDACELQLRAMDEGTSDWAEVSASLVDDYIWKLMDHDLKSLEEKSNKV